MSTIAILGGILLLIIVIIWSAWQDYRRSHDELKDFERHLMRKYLAGENDEHRN